ERGAGHRRGAPGFVALTVSSSHPRASAPVAPLRDSGVTIPPPDPRPASRDATRPYDGLRASVHRFVASSTANTAARSALSLIWAEPVSRSESRPPRPCTP